MTCIVAVKEKGKIYLGGDSCGVSGLDYSIRKDKKVFKNGEMVFGFTSSFRMGQILQYSYTLPKHPSKMSDFRYLCSTFITSIIDVFTEHKYIKNPGAVVEGGIFIIGYRGNLYKCWQDFQVELVYEDYLACGCGESYALGALRVMEKTKTHPRKKVEKALKVAESFSAGVKAPFNIVTL